MIHGERYKPVADSLKEGETLHLRETGIIDVCPLLLHINHFLYGLFHLLHTFLGSLRMQDVLHRVFIFFL